MKKFLFHFFCFLPLVSHANLIPLPDSSERLAHLHLQVQRELDLFNFPPGQWIEPRKTSDEAHVYDVVIIGGGQTGMTIAVALKKEKVDNILIFDENKEGYEGPWLTYARMANLLTPKSITGPDCHLTSLTCRSWFEAKYGVEQWERISCVPRQTWAEYLHWLRTSLNLPIVNETKVGALQWKEEENCFLVPIESPEGSSQVYARKIVLATGYQGSGRWSIPDFVVERLPKSLYNSVYETIDFNNVRGKKIGICGAGLSAFDTALICSEHGAKEIHLFLRREKFANQYVKWPEYTGFLKHFPDLSDSDKWRFISKMFDLGEPPTQDSINRLKTLDNVFLHFDSLLVDAEEREGEARVFTARDSYDLDHLFISVGCEIDLGLREELSTFSEEIALWGDRFSPPPEDENTGMLYLPYLGKHFEFVEKNPGSAPYLQSIFNCTGAALLSEGVCPGVSLKGSKYSVQKLVYGVTSQLFLEEKERYFNAPNETVPYLDN
ncbi:MAG: NAD(P)/FAD-dependent oxidoreductase [Chlamydiales bacterium]|nr:NAD(P)/FAD-dependent oxidoreductase [Chlamydiales bacterium]